MRVAGPLAIAGGASLGELPEERLAIVEFLAAQAATTLERMAREQALEAQQRTLERRIRELERTLALGVEVSASLNAGGVAQALLHNALGLATASRGAVLLLGDGVVASRGLDRPQLDLPAFTEAQRTTPTPDGGLYVGLFAHGALQGALYLGPRVLGPYAPEEIRLLDALGRLAGVAIAKARAYEALQGVG